MKVHRVTVDLDPAGKLYLSHEGGQCSIECSLEHFARCWGASPTVPERDLAWLAAAIYAADRVIRRPPRPAEPSRYIKLCIGVASPESIKPRLNEISETLWFLSGDEWNIQAQSTRAPPRIPVQRHLAFEQEPLPGAHICLYSGGLDSAAGLAVRRIENADPWLAVTVGRQPGIRYRAKQQMVLHRRYGRHPLVHAELVTGLRSAPPMGKQEKTQRTRSILFCIAAGLAAKWSGVSQVEVFENGVGAFNLPLMTGMLDSGRSSRGAHPRFLDEIGATIGSALDHPLQFVLPFCWQTKAEMLRHLPPDQAAQLIDLSHSCVHTSIRERGKDHCGECPACIERQITLQAAGLADRPGRYQRFADCTGQRMSQLPRQYIQFRRLRAHGAIDESEDYRALRSDYIRGSGLRLPDHHRRRFDRLMQQDAHECLAWAGAEKPVQIPGENRHEH